MPQNDTTPRDPELDDDFDDDDVVEDTAEPKGFGDEFLDDLDFVLSDE